MWAIKILNGTQSGKIFPLQKGNNVLGRSTKADIRLADNGVSKNHAQIFVTNDKVIISDLKSVNGTFVNGIQVQNHGLKTGDKVLIHQTIFTIFQLPDNVVFADKKLNTNLPQVRSQSASAPQHFLATRGSSALQHQEYESANQALAQDPLATDQGLVPANQKAPLVEVIRDRTEQYIDDVAMPPIYKTAEKLDFKFILMGFTVAFIFLTTFLAIFPLAKLTRESVLNESQRRALTMARNLAQMNRKALSDDSELSLTTDFIDRESGVEKSMIISGQSGAILAPPSQTGKFLSDPFIIGLRNSTNEKVGLINKTQVAASVPIKFFSSEAGDSVVKAYAVVVYNIDPLAVDFGRTLSLFIQIFLIACVIGAVFFAVQYRLILYPLKNLNKEIDRALTEGLSNIQIPFRLPIFQDLIANINSALSRISNDFSSTDQVAANSDKSVEAAEVVKMFPIPAFAIDPQSQRFIAINPALEGHPLFDSGRIQNMTISELTDKSLFESLKDLVTTCMSNPNSSHTNTLPSQGSENYEITAKAIISANKPSYLLFTVMQVIEEDSDS
jgi:hypothetical protein